MKKIVGPQGVGSAAFAVTAISILVFNKGDKTSWIIALPFIAPAFIWWTAMRCVARNCPGQGMVLSGILLAMSILFLLGGIYMRGRLYVEDKKLEAATKPTKESFFGR